jgi:hypothetical protein
MAEISHYSFGKITVEEKEYSSDIIIFPDGSVKESWWRENGHRLVLSDIEELVAAAPAVIIAGTGAFGMMRPEKNLAHTLEQKNIDLKVFPTKKAVSYYNTVKCRERTGACFHLTC